MSHLLRSDIATWADIVGRLRGAPERVVFLVADEQDGGLTVRDHIAVPDADLEVGDWCVQLGQGAQQRVLQWAASRGGWLIEAHSHLGALGDPAQLSRVDVDGLSDWVPHVRWRLRHRPYAALVFGPTTMDGVAWSGPKGIPPTAIGGWRAGARVTLATRRSIGHFEEDA